MIGRCYRKKDHKYKNYGGRGIKVCRRWLSGFENFLDDMGRRPSKKHSLERKNVHKDYGPKNCIWALPLVQAANKTTTVRIIVGGREMHQAGLARMLGVTSSAIHNHLVKGKSGNQIIKYFKTKRHASKSNPVGPKV
jgi:hypothetical protein